MNIYHSRSDKSKLGKTLRFNLRGIKLILDRPDIKSFDELTSKDRDLLQRRVDEYCKHSTPMFVGYVPAKLVISRLELETILGRSVGNIQTLRRAERKKLLDMMPELESMDFELIISMDVTRKQITTQSPPVIDQFPDAKAVELARKIT